MNARLKVYMGFLVIGLLSGCSGSSQEPATIRLLDEFDSGRVEGGSTDPGAELTPTEWRFDEAGEDQPWEAASGIDGLSVRDESLVARSTTDIPILHVERTSGLENPDTLHSVELRLKVSEGSQLAVMFSDSEELCTSSARMGQFGFQVKRQSEPILIGLV